MTGVLIYGFTVGDFAGEGGRLLAMPWGIVSLVDLYVGFTLFSAWIVFRERSWPRSIVWVVLMMVLGFFTASLYTFLALQSSGRRLAQVLVRPPGVTAAGRHHRHRHAFVPGHRPWRSIVNRVRPYILILPSWRLPSPPAARPHPPPAPTAAPTQPAAARIHGHAAGVQSHGAAHR